MPLYHFNTRDGIDHPDTEGTELADLLDARRKAASLLGGLLKDQTDVFWSHRDWEMDVTDDRGLILFSLRLSAVDSPALRARGQEFG